MTGLWLAVGLASVGAIAIILAILHYTNNRDDKGTMSDQWRAEQRLRHDGDPNR